MGYSAGFSPHPKISYIGAAPTGVSSDAEYLEIGLAREVDVDALREALDSALPPGLDILEIVPAGPGSLAERMQASVWTVDVPADPGISAAVEAFLSAESVTVTRLTKDGRRELDARAAVLELTVSSGGTSADRAILHLVVRQATPAVRPDDVLAALQAMGASVPAEPPRATRLAQGPLRPDGTVSDPLAADRSHAASS